MARWMGAPIVHFTCLGAVLFAIAGTRDVSSAPPSGRAPLIITADRIRMLRDELSRTTGTAPTRADDRALVARAIDDELLYREALARGLDREDRTIDWQLAEKMRFLEGPGEGRALAAHARVLGLDRGDPVIRRMLIENVRLLEKAAASVAPVGDADLQAYVEQHAREYHVSDRVSFWHVFLGNADAEAARAVLQRIRDEAMPPAASQRGRCVLHAPCGAAGRGRRGAAAVAAHRNPGALCQLRSAAPAVRRRAARPYRLLFRRAHRRERARGGAIVGGLRGVALVLPDERGSSDRLAIGRCGPRRTAPHDR
jgi:hypothetical protein